MTCEGFFDLASTFSPKILFVSESIQSLDLLLGLAKLFQGGVLITSDSPKNIPNEAHRRNTALKRFGAAYGNFWKKTICPNILGYVPAGSANKPPSIGPMITPTLKHIGKSTKALDWYLLNVSKSSLSVLLFSLLLLNNL